jgi:outer membrane immunogenic protein
LIALTTTQIPKATIPTEITNESILSMIGPLSESAGFTRPRRGGLAYGEVKHGFATNNALGSFNNTYVNNTSAGWTVGAGAEWGFAPNWSVKAEYLYMDLGTRTFATIPSGTTPVGASIDLRFEDKFQIARVGINYRFGGP